MYHLRKHRAFWYVFFFDKQVSEGMYQQQAQRELARQVSLLYNQES